jgi:hypothetical protein
MTAMNKLLAIKKYHFKLDISESEFKDRFNQTLTNRNNSIGKYFKGNLQEDSFTIKARNRIFDFSMNESKMFATFYELVGTSSQVDSGIEVDLKIRIKPFTQLYWLIGYILLGFVIFPLSTNFELLIIPIVALINYAIMKIGILISAPFFINGFKEIYNLKNDTLQDLNLKIEEKDNLKIIRTKKGKRILNNIGLPFLAGLFLIAIYSDTELFQFLIFVPLTIFVFLAFHQYYLSYKLKQLRSSNEIVDFWLFFKMAKFPIPSFMFKLKHTDSIDLEKIRKKYNILTGIMYACLLISIILTMVELEILTGANMRP